MQSNLKREDLPEFLVSVRQLAEDSKKKLKETRGISLTYRLQLKDDIKAVEKLYRKADVDDPAEKDIHALQEAALRLMVSTENIIKSAEW